LKEIDVGTVVGGKYALVRLLGSGAMGQVWTARHQALGQQFAIKLMLESQIALAEGQATSMKRFANEAQIAAALSRKSRHIAQVTDYGIDDGVAYIVMELLEGETLDKRIERGALAPADAANVVAQIAKGLAVAHGEGVTHRDLKPANVFLTRTEEGALLVKLLDFGIAQMARRLVKSHDDRAPTKLTMKGVVLGSPTYMSPEQAMAESPDLRTDVWSLAVVGYETLVAHTPFDAPTADETIVRICGFRPTPIRAFAPSAPDALVAVFERAFAPSVSKRFQSAMDFARAFGDALGAPIEWTTPLATPRAVVSSVPTAAHAAPRSRAMMIVAALAAIAAIGAATAIVAPRLAASPPPSATVTTIAIAPPSNASSAILRAAAPSASQTARVVETAAPTATSPKVARPSITVAPSAAQIVAPAPTTTKTVDRSAVF